MENQNIRTDSNYYDSIAKGYNELHSEEQLKKLELIGKELKHDEKLKDFIPSNGSLLDVGCGTGISTGFFNAKSKTGIDPSRKLINIAIGHYPMIEFFIGNAEEMKFKDKSFDTVISLTAMQNFDNIEKGLLEMRRVCRKNFILTFLKKSQKHEQINELIRKHFYIIKVIEEDKDIIYFCKNLF